MPGRLLQVLALLEALRLETDQNLAAPHPPIRPRQIWPHGVHEYGDGGDETSIFTVPDQDVRYIVMFDPNLVKPLGAMNHIEDFRCTCPGYRRDRKPCDHIWHAVLRHWA